ncbi:hypothetical protein [Cryptosporangium phraense]|uniref:Restriction endonuclease type IV Mrr domain-containing protein n=1 Tax=Cryptosporangium phraense TaxID=2593070 RepID=A0A545APA5_9ACTN|nr:hypothetical protein [Cryptosporangium phraense]TQS43147.1 hypothetical protein FL583_20065 [Cryptosporangium phraense]
MPEEPAPRYSELQLTQLLQKIIPRAFDVELASEVRLPKPLRMRVDIAFERAGTLTLVEVRGSTPQTDRRIRELIWRLDKYRSALEEDGAAETPLTVVLAIPGSLSATFVQRLRASNIVLWDQDEITRIAAKAGFLSDAHEFFSAEQTAPRSVSQAEEMQRRLARIKCGRDHWPLYQRFCGEVLEYLFTPPLNKPISESADIPRVNRRDFAIPNYATAGFWQFMREHYRADFLVVDAKNFCGYVKKEHILQIANYLSVHKTGLFAFILTRNSADKGAMHTCREQWMLHGKMILVFNDDDLMQMLENRKHGQDPAMVIRQKLEDFRLGV